MSDGVSYCGSSRCWDCGRMVDHKPQGGPQKFHWCRLRWLSRQRWAADQAGWHSGYRFAVENYDDPMVQRDKFDYGSGWAGVMRVGHFEFQVGDAEDGDFVMACEQCRHQNGDHRWWCIWHGCRNVASDVVTTNPT